MMELTRAGGVIRNGVGCLAHWLSVLISLKCSALLSAIELLIGGGICDPLA